MAASLTVGELAALLKTRHDEAAAAASTATARILLDVFAVAERDDFDVRFRCGHQDSLGRLRRGRAQRLCSSVPLGVSVLDSGRRRPEQVRRSDERRAPPPEWFASVWQALRPVGRCRYASPSNIACSHFNTWFDSVL